MRFWWGLGNNLGNKRGSIINVGVWEKYLNIFCKKGIKKKHKKKKSVIINSPQKYTKEFFYYVSKKSYHKSTRNSKRFRDKIENSSLSIQIYFSTSQKPQVWPCCGQNTKYIHDYRIQKIRDIPFQGKETFLSSVNAVIQKKEIEIIKEAIKTAIRNNENFGPTTKEVFESVVSSEIAPLVMHQQILLYGNTHNLFL